MNTFDIILIIFGLTAFVFICLSPVILIHYFEKSWKRHDENIARIWKDFDEKIDKALIKNRI
jgi:hypothetical protein